MKITLKKTIPMPVVRFRFEVGTTNRSIALQQVATNMFALPGGADAYIADEVLKLITQPFSFYRMDGEHFDRLIECIDNAKSDRRMVPVNRIGAGPTEKSARFSVRVIQTINNGPDRPEDQKKEVTLTFTLPVSQVETVGDEPPQLAAPLWLIIEKLKAKSTSEWGAKSRSANKVGGEFVPATLRAATSPKVIVLKAWLTTVRDELSNEDKSKRDAHAVLKTETERLAEEFFQQYLTAESPSIATSIKWGIQIHTKHGERVSELFKKKALKSRQEKAAEVARRSTDEREPPQ